MMDFSKRYNREEFVKFLQNDFLPEDDFLTETTETKIQQETQYIKAITKLGASPSLRLAVYEARHTSTHDARVGLSKEIFRFMANKRERKALVLFVPEGNDANYRLSLISIDLVENEDGNVKRTYSNPRRYSYYLGEGIAYYTPNKYLNQAGRVKDAKDLTERFSVEVLTKAFYQELSDWYAWAVKEVRFPNQIDDSTDDDKYNAESTIRLVTRLIFVWFLKQKHLIPDEFFDEQYIANNLLIDFEPNLQTGLFKEKSRESKYYKAILQNLFFAMLNSPITQEGKNELSERHFRSGRGDYDNNKLMRYEALFKNPQLFVDLANKTVPFLNGGLFDCLDDKDNGNYIDGFSDRKEVQHSLIVPDFLFFGEEAGKNIDLSQWYGDKKKKKVSARGIIDILKRYNFTVEENTPFDQDVSLDPELLGKVFENLLASYNPETQTTARKQTGSFYTPREIVQYMVDESLIAHLKRTVGEELEAEYRKLLQYTDDEITLTDEQKNRIMQSLYECKILDPACGSGAFPVGILQQMVHILSRIDPNNERWKEMILDEAANTLIPLAKSENNLGRTPEIIATEERLKEANHKIFNAKTVKTKRKWKERLNELRAELVQQLSNNGFFTDDAINQLALWNMFDQNASASFFDADWMFGIKDGFDIIIGNPPYGIINKKQNKGEAITVSDEIHKYYKTNSLYFPAQGGMLNIYRLFIVRSIDLLAINGVFSEIFPLAFACDIGTKKLRQFIFENTTIISFEAFPERDNPKLRVFENAKISVCILTLYNRNSDNGDFSLRINRNKYVDKAKECAYISYNDINNIDDKYITIPLAEKQDAKLLIKIYSNSRKFREFGKCNTGEIDMTLCKQSFTKDKAGLPMLRGANIDRYIYKEDMSQGETFYINKSILQSIKNVDDNVFHSERIVMQGITGVNERIRLKMSLCRNTYCANSVNYCTFNKTVNAKYFLALFNSKLMNYVFKLFSTNSNVNGYEVDNLPIVISEDKKIGDLAEQVYRYKIRCTDTLFLENEIDLLVYQLYGLTYDEVKIIDPETQIIKEEYENIKIE